ncbi:MAG: DUF1592 domain-containing protein [Phycisphaera sp.]|nr:DUF1592 domain-containing protein [Phycisphaera sp.]
MKKSRRNISSGAGLAVWVVVGAVVMLGAPVFCGRTHGAEPVGLAQGAGADGAAQGAAGDGAVVGGGFEPAVFFKQHCVKCHGPEKQKGKMRLDTLPMSITDVATADRWADVLDALEAREMPPEKEPAVDEKDYRWMVSGVKGMLASAMSKHASYPRTPMRRMNRFQYNNAVTDLLDLRVTLFALPERMVRDHSGYFDPASGKMPDEVKVGSRPLGKSQLIEKRLAGVSPFPQDLRAEHGFDNRGDHLSLSPLLMESFLKLSRSIVDSRDFGPQTCGMYNAFFLQAEREPDAEAAVRDRLRGFLTRAFRRPVDDETLERYVRFVVGRMDSGERFTEAMKSAVSAVLASPRFLYLYDRAGKADTDALDDYELASRLSFFLWSSIPDDELLALAQAGKLSEPDVLSAQVDRLLNDKKLKRFCDAFPAEWLQLDHIISSKPDETLFPGFYGGQYRASMHMMMEPLLLFEAVLIEDRSIVELIDPPFSYRSALLSTWFAKGAGNFGSSTQMTFKRVANTDRREGGVITNPAVLTMTSAAERTKPITRGAWVATVIFNSPPQPPPADVPPLPKVDVDTANMTLRERLNAHRQREDCKSCHSKIDPFGFALENYGPTGVWREKYENGRDVDASGVLFRTHAFTTPVEFKDAILAEKDRFAAAFVKHVLSYALAREVEVADGPAVEAIVKASAADGYRLRELIKGVVLSRPFGQKSNPREAAAE